MRVDIWSDIVCPWCYIGKRRFEAALARFDHADDVEVRWHSYELNPDAPAEGSAPLLEFFSRYKGIPESEAAEMFDHVTEVAATEGLHFRFDIAKRGNTFDAHRLLHFAERRDLGEELAEHLFSAYFEHGAVVNDHDTLQRLAEEVGLDAHEVRAVLAGDAHAQDVSSDIAQAAAYGISGVPFFVVDGRFGISGAQGPDGILQTLDHAWAQRNPLEMSIGEGACGPDGCAVHG